MTALRSQGLMRLYIVGVSLIELLVALAIAALLLLGLSQIFIGSRQTYSLQEGMSRAQENARFVFSSLQSGLRMAGYFGCGNENGSTRKFYNHLTGTAANTAFVYRFQRPLQGFDASNCDATGCYDNTDATASTDGSQWTPGPLPAEIKSVKPVIGSDILVLRVLSAESAPTIGAFPPGDNSSFTIAAVPGNPNFVQAGAPYAISNCRPRVDIFLAGAGSAGTTIKTNGSDNPFRCDATPSTWGCTNAEGDFRQPPLGQLPATINAEVNRAEYQAYYVGLRADGSPALFMQTSAGAVGTEVADGVESMQITYTIDQNGNGLADDGARMTAAQVSALPVTSCAADPFPADCALDVNWRKVVSVHVALLMRAQEGGGTPSDADSRTFYVGLSKANLNEGGAKMIRTADNRFRSVYETTIAVRNRLSSF